MAGKLVAPPNGLLVGRLCLVAAAIAGVLYVPALDAQPSSDTSALVPVEEIAVNESVPPVEAPVAPTPEPEPTPAPERASTPELAPVPELETEAPSSLQARIQPAQEEPTEEPVEEPTDEPTIPPDDTPLPDEPLEPEPQNEDDPEEFGREFEDPEPTREEVASPAPTPPPARPVSVSEPLPQTGRELLVLAQIGAGLLFVGMTLRLPLQRTSRALSGRDRELLILRTTVNCKSPYQCDQHVRSALEGGIDRETIDRVAAGPDASGWSNTEAALLRAADELHTDATVSDDTWAKLVGTYDKKQLVEIPMLVGRYHIAALG